MITKNTIIRLSPDIIIREEDRVLFNLKKNEIIECNEVGFEIVLMVSRACSVENVIDGLYKKYNAKKSEITESAFKFLVHAMKDNLLQEEQVKRF